MLLPQDGPLGSIGLSALRWFPLIRILSRPVTRLCLEVWPWRPALAARQALTRLLPVSLLASSSRDRPTHSLVSLLIAQLHSKWSHTMGRVMPHRLTEDIQLHSP